MNRCHFVLVLMVSWSLTPHLLGQTATTPWQADYNIARKLALEKNVPLVVVVGSPSCSYCRKMDETTFREPTLISLLQANAIIVKVDGSQEQSFVQAMKIQIFPTTLIAASDGTIQAFLQGYQTAEQLSAALKNATTQATGPEWLRRDEADAKKALTLGDMPQALILYRGIAQNAPDAKSRDHAKSALDKIEAEASAKFTRARQLEETKQTASAVQGYVELLRNYTGTQVSSQAVQRLIVLASEGDNSTRLRAYTAHELYAVAQEELRRERFADALDRFEYIAAQFPDLTEGKSAVETIKVIQQDAAKMTAIAEQLSSRAAARFLALGELHKSQNNQAKALECWERVVQLAPTSRSAATANIQLAAYRKAGVPATTTSQSK